MSKPRLERGFVVLRNFLRRFQVRLSRYWSHGYTTEATERNLPHMTRRPHRTLIASLLAAACLGAGGGAVAYATLHDGTTTVVKQVTVHEGQPVASSSAPLSVNAIYRKAYRGVVEITVTSNSGQQTTPFGGGGSGQTEAEGSGWVYDSDGHIVTNEHVTDGATSISVQFWNGKTYSAHLVGSDKTTDLAVI